MKITEFTPELIAEQLQGEGPVIITDFTSYADLKPFLDWEVKCQKENVDTLLENLDKIKVSFAGISYEDRLVIFREVLADESLVDYTLFTNVNLLVNGYNTLADELFARDDIAFNSIEELLDFKLDLQDVIYNYQKSLMFYYLGALKSMHRVEFTYLNDVVMIPNSYQLFLRSTNLVNLSQVFDKIKDPIDPTKLPLVGGAFDLIAQLARNTVGSFTLLKGIEDHLQLSYPEKSEAVETKESD